MISILIALSLLAQTDTGSIAGVLKTAAGAPAAGVRVAAMAVPESALIATTSASMVSLVATDAAGRFRLENIPPGRYYIAAGRVDFPTYFPGVLDMPQGTIVSVAAKTHLTDISFALQDSSIRIATGNDFNPNAATTTLTVPIQVQVEGGGRQPVSANGYYVTIGFTRTTDATRSDVPLSLPVMNAPLPSAAVGSEYRVSINNLPDGYVLKSLNYGSTNLLSETLKLNAATFLQFSARAAGGTGGNASVLVTLAPGPLSTRYPQGVRISGKAPVTGAWSVYRDEVPGNFYVDGSFELLGVPPGRHIVLLQDNLAVPHFFAALVHVRDQDVDNVKLDSTTLLPNSAELPTATAGNISPAGTPRPLAGLSGLLLEEDGTTLSKGVVTVMGKTMTTIAIGNDGRFAIPHLLPGSYELRVEAFEHFTRYHTVVIGDETVHVDLTVLSNR